MAGKDFNGPGIGTSYVLLLTAFCVDDCKSPPLWKELPSLAYWVLPAAVGVPLIVRALLRHPLARHRPNSSRVAYGITRRARSRGSSLQRISNDCFPSRVTGLPADPRCAHPPFAHYPADIRHIQVIGGL
jgi:hypothetical protein